MKLRLLKAPVRKSEFIQIKGAFGGKLNLVVKVKVGNEMIENPDESRTVLKSRIRITTPIITTRGCFRCFSVGYYHYPQSCPLLLC